jgi:hypothetical protein
MSDNMKIYNECREVPKEAQKTIQAGRLKGYTDINPMWRIKRLTEMFGVCGIGWKIKTIKKWTEQGAGNEIFAFVDIELFIKVNGEWSEGIEGTGGHKLVVNETKGLHNNDEAFKMAFTDAISVACKMLGMGADVYWDKDNAKYTNNESDVSQSQPGPIKISDKQLKMLFAICKKKDMSDTKLTASIKKKYGLESKKDLSQEQFNQIITYLNGLEDKEI